MRDFILAACLVFASLAACAGLFYHRPGSLIFGDDRSAVAQLTQPIAATVLLYPAEGEAVLVDVDIIPGVWLVPEEVFQNPKGYVCDF